MRVDAYHDDEYTAIVNIKKVDESAKVPTRGSDDAAGYDLYAHLDVDEVLIQPGETIKIGTGICAKIPRGWFGALFARSGLASKKGLRPANCTGVIDSDYTGEIIVAMHNDSKDFQTVTNGERVAQLVVIPFLPIEFSEVDELDKTDRGADGFGSTGSM